MSGAICKTCGGRDGQHHASVLDAQGIGHRDHAIDPGNNLNRHETEAEFYIDNLLHRYDDRKHRGRYDLGIRPAQDFPGELCVVCGKTATILILYESRQKQPTDTASLCTSCYVARKHWYETS